MKRSDRTPQTSKKLKRKGSTQSFTLNSIGVTNEQKKQIKKESVTDEIKPKCSNPKISTYVDTYGYVIHNRQDRVSFQMSESDHRKVCTKGIHKKTFKHM